MVLFNMLYLITQLIILPVKTKQNNKINTHTHINKRATFLPKESKIGYDDEMKKKDPLFI